jgi:hypothetical protein
VNIAIKEGELDNKELNFFNSVNSSYYGTGTKTIYLKYCELLKFD